jgi:hypothetical protein
MKSGSQSTNSTQLQFGNEIQYEKKCAEYAHRLRAAAPHRTKENGHEGQVLMPLHTVAST